ncbi:hypothetical protein PCL_01043 [Purpureocillium lilacinum]|uniref:Uncharacterized protein n=1 Tax=Purpureocillium lilacinum TaxID=33203 RepID=A0A2U3E4J0_PURLI|nr:hypothetical protein PCL_01043 [Purpureocillium lilacinum]
MQTQMQVAAAADVWSETVRCSSDDARAGDRCAAAERGSLDVEYCDDETQSGVCAGAGRVGNAINEWPSVNTGGRGGADRRHRLAGQGGWEKQLRCVNVCVSVCLCQGSESRRSGGREEADPPARDVYARPIVDGATRARPASGSRHCHRAPQQHENKIEKRVGADCSGPADPKGCHWPEKTSKTKKEDHSGRSKIGASRGCVPDGCMAINGPKWEKKTLRGSSSRTARNPSSRGIAAAGGSAFSASRARARRQRAWGPKECPRLLSQGFCTVTQHAVCPPARVVAPSGVVQAQTGPSGRRQRPAPPRLSARAGASRFARHQRPPARGAPPSRTDRSITRHSEGSSQLWIPFLFPTSSRPRKRVRDGTVSVGDFTAENIGLVSR